MFPDKVKGTSESLSRRKLVNGAQTNGIVAAHSLAGRFCFCSEVKRDSFGQSRHRDLLKTKDEAIEQVLDADGCDWEVANYGGVNPFYQGVPRGYMGLRESLKDQICDHKCESEEESRPCQHIQSQWRGPLNTLPGSRPPPKRLASSATTLRPKSRVAPAQTAICSFQFDLLHLFFVLSGTAAISDRRIIGKLSRNGLDR